MPDSASRIFYTQVLWSWVRTQLWEIEIKMGVDLELAIDGRGVDGIEAPYTAEAEIELLREIFPEQYWNISETKEFDFIENEPRVRKLLGDFINSVEAGQTTGKAHVFLTLSANESPAERRDYAVEWAKEFERLYSVGIRLQREGKRPSVGIS